MIDFAKRRDLDIEIRRMPPDCQERVKLYDSFLWQVCIDNSIGTSQKAVLAGLFSCLDFERYVFDQELTVQPGYNLIENITGIDKSNIGKILFRLIVQGKVEQTQKIDPQARRGREKRAYRLLGLYRE